MSVQTFTPSTQSISLTDVAVRHFEAKLRDKPGSIIRLSTKSSGCTGYSYVLDFAESPAVDDETIHVTNILTIAVAADALDLLRNTEIDYVKEGVNGLIKFNNPNVVDQCGCGESFNVG